MTWHMLHAEGESMAWHQGWVRPPAELFPVLPEWLVLGRWVDERGPRMVAGGAMGGSAKTTMELRGRWPTRAPDR
jgi:hypothetical protein